MLDKNPLVVRLDVHMGICHKVYSREGHQTKQFSKQSLKRRTISGLQQTSSELVQLICIKLIFHAIYLEQ